jgi:hypothetical protein
VTGIVQDCKPSWRFSGKERLTAVSMYLDSIVSLLKGSVATLEA